MPDKKIVIWSPTAQAELREAFEHENWPAVEERIRQLPFEKSDEFWIRPKLQERSKTDRLPSLREIVAHVFGLTGRFRRGENSPM